MYDYIFFDLDGTLTDPGEGITNSVIYALNKLGIDEPDRTSLYKFIGPPLQDSFKMFYGFSEEKAALGVKYYREYFSEKGLFENKVYPDIPGLLEVLKNSGRTLAVATSKPEEFSVRILKHFDLYKYFDFVAGATMDGSRGKKADIIRYALENLRITDTRKVLMIGDREHDIFGAGENNIDCLAVLFGYGNFEEFKKAGAKYIAENPMDILKYA